MRKHRKLISFLLFVLLLSGLARAASPLEGTDCGENVCPIPTVNELNQPVYAIVSPVGYHAVDMISQAPRLDTLAGKKIALVGGNFMAVVTHDEIGKCIRESYPDA